MKVFWNKDLDVIISVYYDAIYKISSGDSNCISDTVMWPKCGDSRSSMKELITSIS